MKHTHTQQKSSHKSGWHHTQNSEYLTSIRKRIESTDLTWVRQFLDIIVHRRGRDHLSIKDIGCQAFQFYKEIKKRNLNYSYFGYDLDATYVNLGLEFFPELTEMVHIGDFSTIENVNATDVSVCSATIEMVDNWVKFLTKLCDSTEQLIVMRTFLGESTQRASKRQEGATEDYQIWQFAFTEFFDLMAKLGWHPEVFRDEYTDSLPVYHNYGKSQGGVVRTQYVIVAERR
jgi:hypothetical protein